MRPKRSRCSFLSLGLALAACGGDSLAGLNEPSSGPHSGMPGTIGALTHASRGCRPAEVQAVLEVDQGAGEGVAVSRHGDVFVGNINTGEIWRARRGDFRRASIFVDLLEEQQENPLSFVLGMDVSSNGVLYVAVNALLDPALHGLWRVTRNGTKSRVAAAPAFFASLLNDVAIDPRGNVYVSDSKAGAIWRLTRDGEFHVWVESELLQGGIHPVFQLEFGVNGIAYHRGALYAGIHLNGRVIRIPIRRDGAAGVPTIVVEDEALIGNDGIEVDPKGNIYVVNHLANTVQRIRARDLGVETILAEGLSAPATMAFDRTHEVLYVANLSTSAPVPTELRAPALVRAEFAAPVMSRHAGCGSYDPGERAEGDDK